MLISFVSQVPVLQSVNGYLLRAEESWLISGPAMIKDSHLPRFKQRLEIRQDQRPALRDGSDEPGVRPFHRMGEGELRGRPRGLNLVDAARVALSLELRLPFTSPTHHQPLLRNALEDFARVHQAAVSIHFPRGTGFPFAFDAHAEPILLYDLGRCEGLPQLLGCSADVCNVNKCRIRHWILLVETKKAPSPGM